MISIDNFYENPYDIRNKALNAEYHKTGFSNVYRFTTGPWPGKMSVQSFIPNDIDKTVSRLFQKNLRQNREFDSGKFRVSKLGEKFKNLIHTDGTDDTIYAGVVYLSLPEHCEGKQGTIFYTNKFTKEDAVTNQDEWKRVIISKEDNDLSKWDVNLVSYMVFNRLVVYPANRWHGIGELFGDSDENCRIVQLFFWNEIK